MYKHYGLRWGFFLVGLIVLALGVTLTIKGKALGIGPWDVFHYGLYMKLGLTVGTWSIIVGFIFIAGTALIIKEFPKIGAFLNMLLVGIFIDIFNMVLPDVTSLFGEIVVLVLGTVVLGYGVGLYVSANLGAGPRDTVMLLLSEKLGWKVQYVRNGMELIILFFGWLLGGPVGLGTIFIALCTGSVVGISLPQCRALLNFMISKTNVKKKNSLAS